MKKFTVAVLMLTGISVCSFAETRRGYREKENVRYLPREEISKALQSPERKNVTLPSRVDHSQSVYMSSLVNQGVMGSCGSASRICYMFAYEINNYRKLSGKDEANMYPSHFTWLLTGQNSDKENMAIFNGIPNIQVYGGRQYNPVYGGNVGWPVDESNSYYGWMQGYDKWRSAMDNRLEKTASIKTTTDDDLEYLKWWIYNHHNDDSFSEGGVTGGGAASNGWKTNKIPSGKYRAGEMIVTQYGSTMDHGVVWAGYDDDIEYDLNGNGTIEDEERGAIIMLNSWGQWGNNGCAYVPYKIVKEFNGGLGAELYYIRKDYKPLDVFKIKMEYSQRKSIRISIGISTNPNATQPTKTIVAEHFNFPGNSSNPELGNCPMLGQYNGIMNYEPMEFGLDLTDLSAIGIDTRNNFSYFMIIETAFDATGTGKVHELEVIRHEDNIRTVGSINNPVTISGAGKKYIIPIQVPGISTAEPEYIYVPQKRLSVYKCDTEETSGEGPNNGKAIYAIDGDNNTYWHSKYQSGRVMFPHTITFAIDSVYAINGFEYLPRQDHSNGRIGTYELYISKSAGEQGVKVCNGTFENNSKIKHIFFESVRGRYITLKSYNAADGDQNTCMAEFNLFYDPKDTGDVNSLPQEGLNTQITVTQTGSAVQIHGSNNITSIEIYNINGMIMMQNKSDIPSDVITLNTDMLSKGIYFMRVIGTDNKTQAVKFIYR